MPIVTARPNGTVAAGSWAAVGAATLHAATSDDADGSYGRDFGPGFNPMTLDYGTPRTLLSNERVLRARIRVRGTCLESAGIAGDMNNEFGSAADGIIGFSGSIIDSGEPLRNHTGIWHTFDAAGNEWNQTDLNGLRSEHEGRSGATTDVDARLMEAWIDVEYRRRPTVTITGPSGTFFSRSPIVTFSSDMVDAEDQQHNVQVRVFEGTDPTAIDPDTDPPLYDETREQILESFPLFADFPPGDYVAFVRVSKEFPPAASGEWFSAWDGIAWTVSPVPVVTVPKHYRIGCGRHRVVLQTRGGGTQIAEIPYETLTYSRVVDEISDAEVVVGGDSLPQQERAEAIARCGEVLDQANPWEHEIAIYRDEDDRDEWYEAWVGVVLEPDVGEEKATIRARGLFQWFERRRLPTDRNLANTDLAQIFNLFALDALNQDDSPNIVIAPTNAGVTGDRKIFAHDSRRSADELRELSRSGVDWTEFGRVILIGGEEVPTDALARLDGATLRSVRRVRRGLEAGTETTVVGAGGGEETAPIFARAGGTDPDLGLVQRVDQEQGILDTTSAQQAADTRQAFLDTGIPTYVTGTLTEDAPFSHQDLLPGSRVELAIPWPRVVGDFRLRRVDVLDDAEGETIDVEFVPLGTVTA